MGTFISHHNVKSKACILYQRAILTVKFMRDSQSCLEVSSLSTSFGTPSVKKECNSNFGLNYFLILIKCIENNINMFIFKQILKYIL